MSIGRGALAGGVAAVAWLAAEPVIRRVTRLDYGDARLLGRLVTADGPWGPVGAAVHIINGAAFGATFSSLGRRGLRDGIVAAQLENAVLWPMFAIVDRHHPDRRTGHWPSLVSDRRIIAHEVLAHLVFGVVLGAVTAHRD